MRFEDFASKAEHLMDAGARGVGFAELEQGPARESAESRRRPSECKVGCCGECFGSSERLG